MATSRKYAAYVLHRITLGCLLIAMRRPPAEQFRRIVSSSQAWLLAFVQVGEARLELANLPRSSSSGPQSQAGQRRRTQKGT